MAKEREREDCPPHSAGDLAPHAAIPNNEVMQGSDEVIAVRTRQGRGGAWPPTQHNTTTEESSA